jgi:uncharacterized protein YjiS (DUF1127 family)
MHTTTISLSPSLATKAQRALQALALSLSRVYQRWLRARQADATARALDLLDDRLLHDIGLDRSELLSAAAELHGLAERERRQTLFGTPLPR